MDTLLWYKRNKRKDFFHLEKIYPFNSYRLFVFIAVSGIHKAVLKNDLETLKHLVETGRSVNTAEERCRFTPLHLAVIKNSVEILDYLLSRHDIKLDLRCLWYESPLQTAASLGAYELVKKLIDAGADVNVLDDFEYSPLHVSLPHPDVCQLLLESGANINVRDCKGMTPLRRAMHLERFEMIHMLLYYNADPNIPDNETLTPFMRAIIDGDVENQRVLLDYVVDFNATYWRDNYSCTLLELAVKYRSPLVVELIGRGADVNYGDRRVVCYRYDNCAFMDCLYTMETDQTVFKVVWERLCCYRKRRAIDLCNLFRVLRRDSLASVVEVIVKSDNFKLVVDSFTRNENFHLFARYFINSGLDVEQLVVLMYRLLEYGYRPTLEDVRIVFFDYGPCELPRILPYMDVDCKGIYYPESKSYLCAMFDVGFSAEILAEKIDSGECHLTSSELVSVLGYFRDPYLMNVLQSKYSESEIMREILDSVSKVPSLLELARNQTRKHFCEFYRITSMCQFYTIMDYLGIPSIYVSILSYNWKIYTVEQ